jgi:hypothetical protein
VAGTVMRNAPRTVRTSFARGRLTSLAGPAATRQTARLAVVDETERSL